MKLIRNILFILGELVIIAYLFLWCYNWFNPFNSSIDDNKDFYTDTWPPQ